MIKSDNFQCFSIKSYVADVYQNRLVEAILIHIPNILFYGELMVFKVKNTTTIWFTVKTL